MCVKVCLKSSLKDVHALGLAWENLLEWRGVATLKLLIKERNEEFHKKTPR